MDHKVKFPFLQNESARLPGEYQLFLKEAGGRGNKGGLFFLARMPNLTQDQKRRWCIYTTVEW